MDDGPVFAMAPPAPPAPTGAETAVATDGADEGSGFAGFLAEMFGAGEAQAAGPLALRYVDERNPGRLRTAVCRVPTISICSTAIGCAPRGRADVESRPYPLDVGDEAAERVGSRQLFRAVFLAG